MRRKNQGAKQQLERGFIRHVNQLLLGMVVLFAVAAIVFGEMLDVYDEFWWWDDMLHGFSGVLFGLIGLAFMYALNRRQELTITPLFAAVFVVCFALAMGVFWEIYEFTLDFLTKSTMQQWNMGPQAIVIGKSYQGMGLRDTMSDLIMATVGSLLTGTVTYFSFRHKRSLVRRAMRWSFPLKSVK